MRLPALDPSGGELRLDQILLDYEGPQLFTARNRSGSRFLGLHTVPEDGKDQWLYVRVSNARVRELRQARLPIREAFARPEYGWVAIYAYEQRGDHLEGETVTWRPAETIPDALFPVPETFLEKEIEEAQIAVAEATAPEPLRRVLHRAATFPMWEIDPSVLEVLRGLRTQPHVAANLSKRSVIDLAFAIDQNRVDYPARSLSAVLGVTQSLVDALGVDEAQGGARGRLPGQITGATSLDAVATFPSSFGLRLETNVGDLAGDGRAEVALRRLLMLLYATNTKEELEAALREVSKRAQNHFKAFFKAVASGKSDFNIEAATPGEEQTRRVYFTGQHVRWVAKFLDKAVEADEYQITVRGRLLAVSLKTKSFLLHTAEGEEISGRIANECLPKIDEKKINVEYVTTVLRRTEVNEATGEETHKYVLLDISEG